MLSHLDVLTLPHVEQAQRRHTDLLMKRRNGEEERSLVTYVSTHRPIDPREPTSAASTGRLKVAVCRTTVYEGRQKYLWR